MHDPLGFVMWAYPWGEKGSVLEDETGPDEWQIKILEDIGHALKYGWVENNGTRVEIVNGRIWIAVRSGHGIGKSTLMAWLDHWFISCFPYPHMVTTANTDTQLKSKTWRENAKWKNLLIHSHWYKWTATKLIFTQFEQDWYSQAIPWSKTNPQAFAGEHGKYMLFKYDEASEIYDTIWEVSEGAMTEPHGIKIWIVFGNPSLPTGRFAECFGKRRKFWITYEIDARTSKRTDKDLIKEQIDFYGIDHDFVKVRILGKPPSTGANQLIGLETFEAAAGKVIHPSEYYDRPKILGVDIAREGDDQTVLIIRQGRAMYGLQKFRNMRTQHIAGKIAEVLTKSEIDMVFLDMGNIGASVYDILCDWGYQDFVTGVWFAGDPDDKRVYLNKRIEMCYKYKTWLETGGAVPDDNELRDDSIGPTYFHNGAEKMQLERAKDMKTRGLASPDCLMAAALTFAYHVPEKRSTMPRHRRNQAAITDYDMFRKPAQNPQAVTNYDLFK